MGPNSHQMVLFLLAFLCTQITHPHRCMGDDSTTLGRCLEKERKALVEFKDGLHDPSNRLSSWVGEDCCAWHGVRCNNRTGHVVRLDLRNPHPYLDLGSMDSEFPQYDTSWCFSGEINPSLLGLTHLNYFDLSMNCFNGTQIPKYIGSFKELRYLNLSVAGFSGVVPHELGNLSSLCRLDLTATPYYPGLYVDSLRWLSHLSSLQYLDMSQVDLSRTSSSWAQELNALPSLRVIRLRRSLLENPLSLLHNNLTSLTVLDLAENSFNSTIPNWLFNMTGLQQLNLHMNRFHGLVPVNMGKLFPSLKVLDLSYTDDLGLGNISEALGNLCNLHMLSLSGMNIKKELSEFEGIFTGCMADNLESLDLADNRLTGFIPEFIGDIQKLNYLDFSENSLSGSLPVSLGRLSSLQKLDFSSNVLNGTIPEGLGLLSELVSLNLGGNSLHGVISEVHFSALDKLQYLQLDLNPLHMEVSEHWVPPFQLKAIGMASCMVGPKFPSWLKTQVDLSVIVMSNAGISDAIPPWFWNLTSKITNLYLSSNEIHGRLPQSLIFAPPSGGGIFVDLSSNLFDGPVPQIVSSGITLDLSNNSLSGSLPSSMEDSWPKLSGISLSMNKINGSIPSSICKMMDLVSVDLSSNQLSGKVPDCWSKFSFLEVIDFSNNNLSGGIPKSLCSLLGLRILHFRNNNLAGELPISLKNCASMVVLDLGQNKFMGSIPEWIGESLPNLTILRLESNLFDGHIPWQLSSLTHLHILDLSANNLSGIIPATFGNFNAMSYIDPLDAIAEEGNYIESVSVIMKRSVLQYKNRWVLALLRIIDLSNNSLSGNIPEEVASLSGLQSLNLSRNLLTGHIPKKIGRIQRLLSLDLSRNMLSGFIPSSLSNLTSLEVLDLSYNNLSGSIPQGNQLQTFDPSIYAGNPNLCGFPLERKCQDKTSQDTPKIMMSGDVEVAYKDEVGLYVGMFLGFAAGLSIVYWLLLVKKTWRHAYFLAVDNVCDRLYVVTVVNVARLKQKIWYKDQGHTPNH